MQIVIGNATATGKNSLGLGDEIDARTFGVEDRHTILDDFVYDETNEAFVANQNESSHQPPPLGQSSSLYPFRPLVQKFTQLAQAKKNELESTVKGIVAHLRPTIKQWLWRKFFLAFFFFR